MESPCRELKYSTTRLELNLSFIVHPSTVKHLRIHHPNSVGPQSSFCDNAPPKVLHTPLESTRFDPKQLESDEI